jgi:nitrite reductase (NO-forming)
MITQPQVVDRPNGLRWWIIRIALAACLLILGLGTIIWLAGKSAGSDLIEPYTAPGQSMTLTSNSQQVIAEPTSAVATASSLQVATTSPDLGPSSEVPAVVPFETPQIESSPTPTSSPTPSSPLAQQEFTLRTEFRDGKMIYVGVGGDIEGVVNPTLVVAPGTMVRAILVNGDGIIHDLFFPDFDARTDEVGRKGQTAEVTFTVTTDQIGTYVYYCTLPGHREAGQEGQFIVSDS